MARSVIEPSYVDVRGRRRRLGADTRRKLEAALGRAPREDRGLPPVLVARESELPLRIGGAWRLRLEQGGVLRGPGPLRAPTGYHRLELGRRSARLVVVPERCWQPGALHGGGRIWGFAVQLYGIRSARNWGIGDFGDLERLVEIAARLGAGVVGLNPLHAGYAAEPRHISPYSPSSRHALNTLYLEVERIPELAICERARSLVGSPAFRARLRALRRAPLVDYPGVAAAKREVLELLFACFMAAGGEAARERRREFESFVASASQELRRFAVFEALNEKFRGGWPAWPRPYRDAESAAVRAFARRHARRVRFHAWLQWNARLQLDAVQRRADELGLPVGLYTDLALGADAGGAEVWGDPHAYARGATVGAPPDDFSPRGQDWGMPPYSPHALRAAAYQPFIDLLDANMRNGGALRIDHVMALSRLYWVPSGATAERGGYVRYPLSDLLGILALESHRRRCLVIGEDLGTVPPELRERLAAAGVLSYRPFIFEKDASGEFRAPAEYPRDALVCASTHDLPTLKGFWEGTDIAARERLGLSVDAGAERAAREEDKRRIARAIGAKDLDIPAIHDFLARTPSKIMVVQPEDVFGVAEQANLPGSVAGHPNWRRRLPVPLERWKREPRLEALAAAAAPLRASRAARTELGPLRAPAPARPPLATYRLQLSKEFRFADAIGILPYLQALGVSHVYASPFLKARPGSLHGYDIVDHSRVNPEIGTEADLARLLAGLRSRGMGLLVDVVPNHMGVLHPDNAWWQDVLEHGRASRYARYFDVDWQPAKPELRDKVLLPVLGSHYGEALEKGELRLERGRAGRWRVRYYEHRFPVSGRAGPPRDPGPREMHELLERQHYRLAYWRVAADEINYRRFFEINELAGLRVEDREVFDATHVLIARLAKRPGVEGARVDHPDGLADPAEYLARLRALFPAQPYLTVEKILADYETLPPDWPVHGTTGYRFANLLTGLFVDHAAERRFDRIYASFTGERRAFSQIAFESRLTVMGTTLAAELNRLTHRLERIAAGNRATRDYTASGLRRALAEVAARFPVYRTYVSPRGVSAADRRFIDWAVGAARRASRAADASVFDFIRGVLTLEAAPPEGPRRRAMLEFAMHFQQFTAPVVAKGDEDTAFYRYHRLASLNEVGSDPRRFGFSLGAFHAASEDRARNWPYTMLGTSTHDTKRSEDVRARLGVLSEMSGPWRLLLRRWSRLNRGRRAELDGDPAPSRGDEYLYYQSLLGIWPGRAPGPGELERLRERLKAYMLKAAREAKVHTSWINPDERYEAALARFVEETLEPRETNLFLREVNEAAPRLERLGMLVALSQALLKVASPGVPDYYQGTELWDFSLVDPDNRRPVDYALRERLLSTPQASAAELLASLADGRAKLHVVRRGLAVRASHPVFHGGEYTALYAGGGREQNVCAFALRRGPALVIAVAPRLFVPLMGEGDLAPLGRRAWGEARLPLPQGASGALVNALTGETHEAGGGSLALADVLASFPVALLVQPGV